jgi:ATP-dependent DNA helicase RecG
MDIKELKGIGEKTANLLNRLSVYTVEDLVGLFPRDYDVYAKPVFVSEIKNDDIGTTVSIDAVVAKSVSQYGTANVKILSTLVKDEKGDAIKCNWFNMPFLRSSLKQGMRYVFRGHLAKKQGIYLLEQPQMYTIAEYNKICGSMMPIYPLTKGLSNKTVTKAVRQALEKYNTGLEKEFIPPDIRSAYGLAEHNFAMVNIHFPKSQEDYLLSRKRLAFEEFFLFVLAIRNMKEKNAARPNGFVIANDHRTDLFLERLPFKLTNAQMNTWREVKQNMAGTGLMSRLIQGDVGSGKTIIAVLALMNTAFAGYQGAMMVPTEVLAKQQYESVCEMFEKYDIPLRVVLLSGSMSAAAKRKTYEKIKNHEADIVIGTHAVIQDKVEYDKLGLVITDEQHRFGVNQRKALSEKGDNPHILVMSATPIPRTLAIIVYGDLDISIIDELPAERLPIKNCVVDKGYRENAYRFITGQVNAGRQAYVICPMVEESENIEAENVVEYTEKLRKELPQNIRIDYLHGKMKSAQKEEIMERFAKRELDVLVSTTVIEVGVNVPNATVMMVENADRFGLAQLHQLRGRVGRGKYQSYCIFVSGSDTKKAKERLEILNRTNDGFKIAEEDLAQRGPGDFFGIRQSGDLRFKIGDIFADSKALKEASDAATAVLREDPMLESEEHMFLKKKVQEYTIECLENINL